MAAFALSPAPGFGEPAGGGAQAPPGAERQLARKVVINIPSRTLWVYEGEKIIRYFPVGLGRPGFPTPVGRYSIIRKVLNPGWENPYLAAGRSRVPAGPGNPLGTRWMGFKKHGSGEYGIHGTDRPASVGRFSSHGCVRMKVADAEALFDMVDIGTPVEVVYDTALIRQSGDEIRLVTFRDPFGRGGTHVGALMAELRTRYPAARIDDARVREALANPTEKPVTVGRIVQGELGGYDRTRGGEAMSDGSP